MNHAKSFLQCNLNSFLSLKLNKIYKDNFSQIKKKIVHTNVILKLSNGTNGDVKRKELYAQYNVRFFNV